ncbi:phosphoribosylaminoimidazolesuccinocarboxamide synthase [Lysinimonas soli]|uniref:Phosphoribosylaminoimidazole-succinocarboxamide synthase n=1 Tax=Lysinimonas soli TaxID=1074233 RepID=A0ABW0NNN1_9MICO
MITQAGGVPRGDARLEALHWTHVYSGKVRDLYTSEAAPGRVLVVASDRVSAFDHLLEPGIPGKGAHLTQLSLWWFGRLGMRNHLAAAHPSLGEHLPPGIAERAMLVHELDMHPIEAVVRAYLVGSGWLEYQQTQSVCGIPLPAGLGNGDRLPEPIYTPAFKAPLGEHDENISFDRTVELLGAETAAAIRDASLTIFRTAAAIAEQRGLILADTKFEFGSDPATGELTLADEVLTSDSSRYWDAETYAAGGIHRLDSFDKQIVRDWLAANWDKTGTPPELPAEIVERTAARYEELIERLTA